MADDLTPTATVIEAASWSLATRLVRRHPDLTVRRTHPGNGQYDCLTIRSSRGVHVDLNRAGRIHVHAVSGGGTPNWEPVDWATFLASDPRDFVAHLEQRLRLEEVGKLPVTTPRVLTYRVLAALARLHAMEAPIEISMDTIDSEGMGGGESAEWLVRYPAVGRLAASEPFAFWCARSKEFEVVVHAETATCHVRSGASCSLDTAYDQVGRNFQQLLAELLRIGS